MVGAMARQLLGSCLPAGGCAEKLLAMVVNNQRRKNENTIVRIGYHDNVSSLGEKSALNQGKILV
jgi:hypothetical protein